ncbi:hypothetical protein EYY94_08235 [Obesumbacterium proteus]|nr:hypothetical protein EYY94_08235 [Obesumbacterium proteus]
MQLIYNYDEYYKWIVSSFLYDFDANSDPLVDEIELFDFTNKSQPESYPCLVYIAVNSPLEPFPSIKFIYTKQLHEWSEKARLVAEHP